MTIKYLNEKWFQRRIGVHPIGVGGNYIIMLNDQHVTTMTNTGHEDVDCIAIEAEIQNILKRKAKRPKTLKTENPLNADFALAAFIDQRKIDEDDAGRYMCVFEHGQLWVVNSETGAQWSVVDAEGVGTVDGFDFELVAAGDED